MTGLTSVLFFAVILSQSYSAPQFISFKDGKLGVSFGGYHAGVGIGGLLGGTGANGGLYAEAGTPHGQSAQAGLGGLFGDKGGTGGIFAGATAGNRIKAQAGLGGLLGDKPAGAGFASAQAGDRFAATGMVGEATVDGAAGVSFTSTKDVVVPVETIEVKPVHKKVHAEFNIDSINEVKPLPQEQQVNVESNAETENKIDQTVQPILVKEVYVEPKTKIVEKEIVHTHYKPRRHHVHKTAFLGGYIGGQGEIIPPPVQPAIQKRIDYDAAASVNAGVAAEGHVNVGANADTDASAGTSHVYTKQVTYQRNPNFFQDIFNIPISTLKAVGNLLGNTAANTNISVQKSASVSTDSDSLKHHPSASSSVSSDAQISVETPTASKFFDDIFAIPINTLGAVNKFLENNVSGRKTVQISEDVNSAPVRRLGHHARRRANKHVVIVQEEKPVETDTQN